MRVRQHFDLAGLEIRIDGAGGRGRTLPSTLITYSLRSRSAIAKVSGVVRVAHDLHQPFTVAQVDEDHAAMVATPVHPTEHVTRWPR